VDTAGTVSSVSYVHADGLNTPRVVTDASGTVLWQWAVQGNPFGEQSPTAPTGYVFNLRFPGQYYDVESGLSNWGYRTYDATTGRSLQSDPIGLAGGQASTYAYALNAPLNAFDDDGLKVAFANPGSKDADTLRKAYERVKATPRGGFICKTLEDSPNTYTIDITANGPLRNDPNPSLREMPAYIDYANHGAWFDPSAKPLMNTTEGLQPATLEDLMSHELGHLATEVHDTGPGQMDNINLNENPVRQSLGHPKRVTYNVLP